MNKFQQDLKTGNIGEEIILEFLKENKATKSVLDVRNDKFFQDIDTDFIQETLQNEIYKIEVKTDTLAHKTGNLAYEHTSNKYGNTIGCFEKTRADYIFYYLTETKELYILHTESLRNYVLLNKNRFREVDMGDNALGYLIKLEELIINNIGWKMKL